MVYRKLLVSTQRIHLSCFRVNSCLHLYIIYTSILRVCRLVSAEALDVLYGENEFAFTHTYFNPAPILDRFSAANMRRIRKLGIDHQCFLYGINIDPGYEYGSDWGADSVDSDVDTASDDGLIPDEYERYVAPAKVKLQPNVWRPILANLTSLTITLTLECCSPRYDEYIISDVKEVKDRCRQKIKEALEFYGIHVPASVKVHRRVRCEDHECFCSVKERKCNRIQRYIKAVWVGDSEAGKSDEA
jgi:hypothetical protein